MRASGLEPQPYSEMALARCLCLGRREPVRRIGPGQAPASQFRAVRLSFAWAAPLVPGASILDCLQHRDKEQQESREPHGSSV